MRNKNQVTSDAIDLTGGHSGQVHVDQNLLDALLAPPVAFDHGRLEHRALEFRHLQAHHDYKCNGTTTLFAALDVATGRVIGECMDRHRHDEYLRFLGTIDRTVPAGLDVHVIADNYATHKHADVRAWVESHPRFRMHYTPTSSSWLNRVEHRFGDLERDAIRRGVFPGLKSLVDRINRHIDAHNRSPRPYTWTASAETILAKVKHAKEALNHSTIYETDH